MTRCDTGGPGIVKLAAIYQFVLLIKHINIWRARCAVSLSDCLGFIKQVRERIASLGFFFYHFFKAVGGVSLYIITIDAYKCHPLAHILLRSEERRVGREYN